jgi:hypothetical protein
MPTVGGQFGCESSASGIAANGGTASKYVSIIKTSASGDIQVTVTGINSTSNGRFVYLQPSKSPASAVAPGAGDAITAWLCGASTADLTYITRYLPGSCRATVTPYNATFASGT